MTALKKAFEQAQGIEAKREAAAGLTEFQKSIGVSAGMMILPGLLISVVLIGGFFAMKAMCDLPVAQLTQSGFEYIPDLTALTKVADPYYLMSGFSGCMLWLMTFVCLCLSLVRACINACFL